MHMHEPARRLQSLELYVEELTGSEPQLDEFCVQMKSTGFSWLKQLKLCFWSHTEMHQTMRNEDTATRIVQALRCHPSLEDLEIRAPIEPFDKESNNIDDRSKQQRPVTCPTVIALMKLVQTNKTLKRLRLNLWSRRPPGGEQSTDHDTWYIAPLTQAMSHPLFYTHSNLHSIEFLFTPLPRQADRLIQSLEALEGMVRNNYNITNLFLGGPELAADPVREPAGVFQLCPREDTTSRSRRQK